MENEVTPIYLDRASVHNAVIKALGPLRGLCISQNFSSSGATFLGSYMAEQFPDGTRLTFSDEPPIIFDYHGLRVELRKWVRDERPAASATGDDNGR